MPLIWRELAALETLEAEWSNRLLRAAVTLQTEHMANINVFNPIPYDQPGMKGDYPKKRTGFLQAHIWIEPTDPKEIAKRGHVRIGYAKAATYGMWLELRGWKGIWDTALSIITKLYDVVGKGIRIESHTNPAGGIG